MCIELEGEAGNISIKAAHMALRRLTDCIEEMQEKHQIPNQKREGIANCTASKQYVRWEEVQDFLLMAEEAISAKDAAAQR